MLAPIPQQISTPNAEAETGSEEDSEEDVDNLVLKQYILSQKSRILASHLTLQHHMQRKTYWMATRAVCGWLPSG
ncbi:hypothetical protein GCM10009569_33500 [Arthrobacter russicus]